MRRRCGLTWSACASGHALGTQILVLGSGRSRNVPDGFDEQRAFDQLIHFARDLLVPAAERVGGVTIAFEALNRGECNFINTLAEVRRVVEAVDRRSFTALFDAYHFWQEHEESAEVGKVASLVRHVHVADAGTRALPGASAGVEEDYHAVFTPLKEARYDGRISIEASTPFERERAKRSLAFLKAQWAAA